MELLLTGGTGFFGKALLRHWQAASGRGEAVPAVTVLSRAPGAFLARHPEFAALPWLRWHPGSILLPGSLPPDGAFTHILHAAADSTHGALLTPMQRYAQIVDGTRNLLEYAAQRRVPRFLLASSGGAYGPQPPDMEAIAEEYGGMADPLEPQNAYSVAKRCAEHLCALYRQQHGLETVIARGFTFVGRDLPLDAHFAIGNFIRDALAAPAITVNGDGTPVRSYMDQRDLAHWLDTLLRRGRAGHAYNVGAREPLTIAGLAHLVRDVLAPEKPVLIAGNAGATGSRNRYVPATDKACNELGLALRHTLPESILHTARYAPSSSMIQP